jgi:uncharacterized integral membrane protein
MTPALLHARAGLRAQWRTWLGLAVLVAVVGGAVIALGAGARRTDTAYARFLRSQRGADVGVYLSAEAGSPIVAQIDRLPEVTASATALALPAVESDFVPVVAVDGRYGRDLNRFKFLAGRPLRADRADEAVVGFVFAKQRHLHVGSRLTIHVLPESPFAVALHVVGIEAAPSEFPPRTSDSSLSVYLSPALLDTPIGARAAAAPGATRFVVVRLRHGTRGAAPFIATLQGAAGGPVGSSIFADQATNVQRSMHLQAVALWLMAAFVGLAAALVLLQLLTRQSFEDGTEYPTLAALGMTSAQLAVSGLARTVVVATTGAVAAGLLAWVASPLLPLGSARTAEPHPGFAFDAAAVGAGVVGVAAAVAILGGAAQLRARRRGSGRELFAGDDVASTSGLGRLPGVARLPLTVGIGARLALQPGRGRTAVPVRSTLVAVAVGIGAMAASVTFGASLSHLLDTPKLYGVTFDAHIQGNGNFSDIRPVIPLLRSDPAISAFAVGTTGLPMRVGNVNFGAQATSSLQGSLEPTVIAGRLPTGPDEILLGSKTMHDLHTGLGRTVDVTVAELPTPLSLRVVGRGVLASITDTEQLGRGAVVSPSAGDRLATTAPPGFKVPPPGDAFVRFRPGPGRARAIADLQARLGPSNFTVFGPVQPTDVADFGQVRNLPAVLAALLGVTGVMTIVHLLASAMRRRRRDLAVLKSLGMPPAKVSAAICWQATTVGLVSTVFGLPVGIAAGRWAWNLVSSDLGVVAQPQVPLPVIAGLGAAVLVVVNLVACGPAVVAGRVAPALVLRTE